MKNFDIEAEYKRARRITFGSFAVAIVIWISAVTAIVYVAAHFIGKFW